MLNLLIGALITFVIVILVLYLVDMLPIDGRAKPDRARDCDHHRHHLAAKRYLAVF